MIRQREPWESGEDKAWASMPDGRVWGPFETSHAAREWERFFGMRADDLATAKDLYEGSVQGDAFYLISEQAVEWGVYPLREIHDVLSDDDNGRVVADHASGLTGLHPSAAILIDCPGRQQRSRKLAGGQEAPAETDCRSVEAVLPCEKRGQIVVLRDGVDYLVAWRQDARASRSLPVLGLHTIRECAMAAARRAARWHDPGKRRQSSHIRDYQRALVYKWEDSLVAERRHFADVEECRAFAAEACEAMGLPVPEIKQGRRSLENHSYYSPYTGIVLQRGMMNSLTVLHELAHYAVYRTSKVREASHGPCFTGSLAGMLSAFAGTDLDAAIAGAAEAGVDLDEELARSTAEAAAPAAAYR